MPSVLKPSWPRNKLLCGIQAIVLLCTWCRTVSVTEQMARLQLSCLGVLLLVALSGPASATSTQSLGDLASTGLPEVRPASVTAA